MHRRGVHRSDRAGRWAPATPLHTACAARHCHRQRRWEAWAGWQHCPRSGKVLIVHEDSRTGGIGESLAAVIQEQAFEFLDAPIRIVAALGTPVPYSPPLEEVFLPGEADIERAARRLAAY